jgi:nickel/cobalt transporter (NicO) family protein
MLPFTTALLLGSLHAFEADHMAAVTAFAVRRPGRREAAGFGIRWAAGHGGAILLVGAGLLFLGAQVPSATEHLLERFVGVVMIGLGIWTLRGAGRMHAHPHADHDHATPSPVHAHGGRTHAVTAVGVVHGLAGSGAAVAIIPVVALDSPLAGLTYLFLFALGTILAMALYGVMAGFLMGRASTVSLDLARTIARITGAATIVIGVIWLVS